jgi:low temperature requirement protein LtrA
MVAAGCLVIALCLWWIYFDLADTSVVGRGVLGLIFVYAHFPLLAGVTAFGEGTRLAITEAAGPGLDAGTRWALAGGIGAFALSLAVLHMGAEWTSLGDGTFLGRLWLATFVLILAAAGGWPHPWRSSGWSRPPSSRNCSSRRSASGREPQRFWSCRPHARTRALTSAQ